MVSFPYYSHIFRDSYGNGMGIVWEASHKQVPLLGVPGITLEYIYIYVFMYPSRSCPGARGPFVPGFSSSTAWEV